MNKHLFNFALPIISAIALPISYIAYSADSLSAIDVLNSKLQEINKLQDELRTKQSEIGQHRRQLEEQLATQRRQAEAREAKLSVQVQELQQQLTGTITELTTRLTTLEAPYKPQTFKLGGDLSVFYPVYFQDHCYHLGNTQLTISRHIHEDISHKGGLVARISYHPGGWGSGADYAESLLTYSIQPFVADITQCFPTHRISK